MRRIVLGTLLLSITMALAACDSIAVSSNRQGNRLYRQGKYDEALSAYEKAQAEQPDLAEPYYNIGNTLHRKEDYQGAVAEMRQGLSRADRELRARAYYNLGNSFYRQGQFAEAIAAYKEALKLNPDDQDAKHNLELAQQRLEEQQLTPSSQPSQCPLGTPTPQPSPTDESGEAGDEEGTPTPQPSPGGGQGTETPTPQGGQQTAGASTPQPEATPTPAAQARPEEEEGMTEEQALQLLEALGQDEQTLQQYLQRLQPIPDRPVERDW